MRVIRIVLWALGVTAATALVGAAVIYAMACRIPPEYQYRPLTREQQKEAIDRLVADHVFGSFGNKAGAGRPFTWTISARRANDYLASMDEIASQFNATTYPSVAMERAGFARPAVAMRPSVLTLMIHAKEHDKIFSVDLAFEFDSRGDLTARTLAMRIGVLPVPQFLLASVHRKVRRRLAEHLAEGEKLQDAHIGPVPVARFARLLGNVIGMLDGRYVHPELVWQGKHRVLADRVEITEGKLAVHFVPVPHRQPATASARPQGGAG